MFEIREKPNLVERAYLVGLYFDPREKGDAVALLDELEELVTTLGIGVIGKSVYYSREMQAKFLCGTGKAEEISQDAHGLDADCVVFDNMMAPSQQREWERFLDVTVIDREEVILDIFAARAKTREAQLQVDLARMQYALPRMAKMWSHLDRQGGGSGGGKGGAAASRGEGEKQIEVDRRLARDRISFVEKELEVVRRQRATQRKEREKQAIPHGAIVGYTNAGKSSLLNAITGADVMAKDMLFATLDTTTRKHTLPKGQDILLTDTVGFIRNLPHRLVESFKATLEEAVIADFLIQVVDASDPEAIHFYETTLQVLEELGAHDKKMITVLNKMDRVPEGERDALIESLKTRIPEPCIAASVKEGRGMDELLAVCEHVLEDRVATGWFRLPQARGDLLAQMYTDGKIFATEYEGNDIYVEARLPKPLFEKLSQWKSDPPSLDSSVCD